MKRIATVCAVIGAAALLICACKDQINPHVLPEADAEVIVASTMGIAQGRPLPTGGPTATASKVVILTLNNAPSGAQTGAQEIAIRELELFTRKNPGIRVEYSPWKFSPESFFERAKTRTLTDIIEISVSQAVPIIDLNYAADITDNVLASPEVRALNPETLLFLTRNGRHYGIPGELHTMALFYNRRLVAEALKPADAKPGTPPAETPKPKEKPKGQGADSEPRDFLDTSAADLAALAPVREKTVAQFWPWSRRRQQQQQQQSNDDQQSDDEQRGVSRRGQQEVQDYYNLPSGRQPQRPGSLYDTDSFSAPQREPGDAMEGSSTRDTSDIDSAAPFQSKKGRKGIDGDILTSETQVTPDETPKKPKAAPEVTQPGMPTDWSGFIKLATALTDHSQGRYGYAPVMFAEEGGREFSQWAIQTGLSIEISEKGTVNLDVNTSAAAEVATFLKELRWRYDVTPPIDRCYYDNLVKMFADGQVAMMMMPATGETIDKLVRLGMPMDDIGIAALPGGPDNRNHLTFGRCYILNSQLNKEKRDAAFKWLMFQHDPERIQLRQQLLAREQEMSGLPSVPLYTPQRQQQIYELLKATRTFPLFRDYESVLASQIRPEPPYFTDRLFEAIAQGVRPIVERKDSRPSAEIGQVCLDFEAKYLRNAPTKEGLQRYLKFFAGK
ncbi:MAG: extracellular solute-binding protein [Candidatus Sumerlaeaceae bacterium]|nr:extracellular solute-binding protein [Candidatus Sumerlaeaceae bacterium]